MLADYYRDGTDLGFVLDQITDHHTFDVEADPGDWDDADTAAHRALVDLKEQVLMRQAVNRGPNAPPPDYCGVSRGSVTACGPELGLPWCVWHDGHRPIAGEN